MVIENDLSSLIIALVSTLTHATVVSVISATNYIWPKKKEIIILKNPEFKILKFQTPTPDGVHSFPTVNEV